LETSAEYLDELRREFPKLRIIDKADDPLSRSIDRALRVLTFGGQSAYTTRYVTTIGQRIYLPTSWAGREEIDKIVTLRHEAVHLRQFRRLTLIGMSLIYLLPILPLGLAWGRARLEWEAYAETIRATAELKGEEAARDPVLHAHIVKQFTGPAYGWMWPFGGMVRRWIAEELGRL
jgi:hypothetical protein